MRKSKDCFWCGKRMGDGSETLDHLIPLSMGGGNDRDNMVLACGKCNEKRGSEMPSFEDVARRDRVYSDWLGRFK